MKAGHNVQGGKGVGVRVEGTVHQPWNLPGVNLIKNPSLHFQSEQVQVYLSRLSWGLCYVRKN